MPTGERAAVTASLGLKDAAAQVAAVVPAVMDRAAEMGLLSAQTHQVGARLPVKLLEQAKRRTGIDSTTDLLAFVLVAVEDDFARVFAGARGTLDPDLDIGF